MIRANDQSPSRATRMPPTRRPSRAFTLIELILVMALLATILALASPALSRFFHGRSVTEEARRLIALTRLGHNEAISRSMPMELWIEPSSGRYGLRTVEGYGDPAEKQWEFHVADGLHLDLGDSSLDADGIGKITFHPDGTNDADSSQSLTLRNDKDDVASVRRIEDGTDFVLETSPETQP